MASDKYKKLGLIGLGLLVEYCTHLPSGVLELLLTIALTQNDPQEETNQTLITEGLELVCPGLGTVLSVLFTLAGK